MYEKFTEQPISRRQFGFRVFNHFIAAALILALSLFIGTWGYVYFAQMNWQAAFLNTSLLLSGIGLAQFPHSPEGQLFVSMYALYAGLIYLALTGILIAPILHRFLHHFHWTEND
jgi:membrane protein YdbS with pleckstrin-like domain